MIYYLVSRKHAYTMNRFLSSWGKALAPRIRVWPYERLLQKRVLGPGTYIFSDLERLDPGTAERLARVWAELARARDRVRLLNHPTRSMRRYELLRTLNERGDNAHNIYRLTENRRPQGFPVFLRTENEHSGSLTPLLQTPAELDQAIQEISRQGRSRENKAIVEFCDTSDARGLFRKYSAFLVGERIIPRHVFFSQNWVVKLPELTDQGLLAEERRYLAENPHQEELKAVFDLARINYGRIDYGLREGKVQVWEINTNPLLIGRVSSGHPARREVHLEFLRQIRAAFEALDAETGSGPRIRISPRTRPFGPAERRRLRQALSSGLGLIIETTRRFCHQRLSGARRRRGRRIRS